MNLVQLPLYPLRAFNFKLEEGPLVILDTQFNRYILDDTSLVGDFADRRIQLREQAKSYKHPIYNLNRKVNTLSQLINCDSTHYVNEQGRVFKYVKKKYYRIVLKRVISSTQIFNGKYQCYVAGYAHPFVTKEPYEFLSLVVVDNSLVLFDVHHCRPEKVRVRVKI